MQYEEQEQQLEIPPGILAALSRHKILLISVVTVLAIITGLVVSTVPAVYRSQAIVLVETQQIPNDLVKSTITAVAAEQIQLIRQRVMTREKLLEIANKYPSIEEHAGPRFVSDLVNHMRDNIFVELIDSNVGRRSDAATIAFSVGFDALSPTVAQAVANDLVTLFLNENVKSRTARASETTDFLQVEAEKLKAKLAETEQAIAGYKQEHKDALPEHLDLYISMLERAQTSRVDTQRQIEVEKNQISLYEMQSRANPGGAPGEINPLELLEREYSRLKVIYRPTHPAIIQLKDEIAQLQGAGQGDTFDSAGALFAAKISASNAQVRLLTEQVERLDQQITELQAKVIRIPQVERGLLSLNRDYKSVKEQYEQVVANTMQAQMSESLEQGRKAERLSILEPPLLPDQPYKPNRKKLLGMGLAASLGFPLGLLMLVGFLDKSVRGEKALERILGHAPLVVIGYIETDAEKQHQRKKLIFMLLGVLALILIGMAVVNFTLIPLETLLYKAMIKLGMG